MIYEVLIGQYNRLGKFDCSEWALLFRFFNVKIDRIIIYSFDEDEMLNIDAPISYKLLDFIDNSQCLYGFEIAEPCQSVLEYLRDYSYSIDGGIQFIYLFKEGILFSELELEDSDNYMTLNLSSDEEAEFKKNFLEGIGK